MRTHTGRIFFMLKVLALLAAFGYLGVKLVEARQEHRIEVERLRQELDAERLKTALVMRVIQCESSGRHDVWGDGGRSYGIAQFQRRTFYSLAHKAGYKGLDWKNRRHQIGLLRWAVDNGAGTHWTCYRKYMGA